MDSSDVLTALEELDRWRARRVKIQKRLAAIRRERWTLERELEKVGRRLSRLAGASSRPEDLDDGESLLLEEIGQVEGQIAYYTSLTKDMKKALEPPRLGQLLRSFNKGG